MVELPVKGYRLPGRRESRGSALLPRRSLRAVALASVQAAMKTLLFRFSPRRLASARLVMKTPELRITLRRGDQAVGDRLRLFLFLARSGGGMRCVERLRYVCDLPAQMPKVDLTPNAELVEGARHSTLEFALEQLDHFWPIFSGAALGGVASGPRRTFATRCLPELVRNEEAVHEMIAWSGYSAYKASKAGLAMMTKTLGQEATPHGVRVLTLGPGAMETPIKQSARSDAAGLAHMLVKIPLGRRGRTDEITNMAAVLSSDVASYTAGSTVFVDGTMKDYPEVARGG